MFRSCLRRHRSLNKAEWVVRTGWLLEAADSMFLDTCATTSQSYREVPPSHIAFEPYKSIFVCTMSALQWFNDGVSVGYWSLLEILRGLFFFINHQIDLINVANAAKFFLSTWFVVQFPSIFNLFLSYPILIIISMLFIMFFAAHLFLRTLTFLPIFRSCRDADAGWTTLF